MKSKVPSLKKMLFCATAFLLCMTVLSAPAFAAGSALPDAYQEVLEGYKLLLSTPVLSEMTEESFTEMGVSPLLRDLTETEKKNFGYALKDLNGDGVPELFLGVNNEEFNDSFNQVWTVIDGKAASIYTTSEGNALYLLSDGLMKHESWDEDGSYAHCLYRLNSDGSVTALGGIMYNEKLAKGPYFSIQDDTFPAASATAAAVSEDAFDEFITECLAKEVILTYQPILK